ncbi:hypothetical protein Bbelb_104870 [Branchiostoma belcheri]|nr:hypothetical protein Bbelb_104870 [Branchiostoma belcheri]
MTTSQNVQFHHPASSRKFFPEKKSTRLEITVDWQVKIRANYSPEFLNTAPGTMELHTAAPAGWDAGRMRQQNIVEPVMATITGIAETAQGDWNSQRWVGNVVSGRRVSVTT